MTTTQANLRRPTLLVILDGFGLNPDTANNAIALAKTPNFDHYFSQYPLTSLQASGRGVGLPDGQMGNSEVGHMTIGSGSIVRQDLVRIDDAVADGSFYDNPALLGAIETARANARPLHLVGLVSDGGVHSHIDHLYALIQLCQQSSVTPHLHMISDGRDTAQQAALEYLPGLEKRLAEAGGCIASLCGRYYAMDRDKRWDRVKMAWDNLATNSAYKAETASAAIEQSYAAGIYDEFIKPVQLPGMQPMQGGDAVVFFNYRNDRVRQICAALVQQNFDAFDRGTGFRPVKLVSMTHYDDGLDCPVAFAPVRPEVTLGSVISEAGFRQLHCAETEKYPHVTFFFNGGRETPYTGEERSMVASPRVATYDLQPEMSAHEVADRVVAALVGAQSEFVVVNFANGDMVGHTAVRSAIIEAVEVLDREVGRVLEAALANNYSVILTSDHGNCDEMIDPQSGKPHTQHSNHPVPCLVIDASVSRLREGDNLSAIAPTVLQLMGIAQPQAMGGQSLIVDVWSD